MLFHRPAGAPWRARSQNVTADQLLRFAGVGTISTLGYLFLFVAWRPLLGPLAANAVAMAIATLFNTAVHRELSRHVDGAPRRGHRVLAATSLYAVSLAATTTALVAAEWLFPGALVAELIALTAANLVAAIFRFALLRAWIFPSAGRGADHLEVSS
jgi:putative flippase GtrA